VAFVKKRLKILLHLYNDQDERRLKRWWSDATGIPLDQFHASYIHTGKRGTYKRKSEYGTVSLRYCDKKLFNQILYQINTFSNRFSLPE
jgi:hypothetical protein